MKYVNRIIILSLLVQNATSFTIPTSASASASSIVDSIHTITAITESIRYQAATATLTTLPAMTVPTLPTVISTSISTIGYQYTLLLQLYPLPTKMITGGTLSMIGDSIAQYTANINTNQEHDTRRTISFGLFDMSYRAFQHLSFPYIINNCHGQYITTIISSCSTILLSPTTAVSGSGGAILLNEHTAGSIEQTLVSQLIIIPFIYYPIFYSITSFIQNDFYYESILQRVQTTFIPLMKRNLLFWIPIQFIQFNYIDINLQIPFLSVCGLVWTFILSILAGSVVSSSSTTTSSSIQSTTTSTIQTSSNLPKAITTPILITTTTTSANNIKSLSTTGNAKTSIQQTI